MSATMGGGRGSGGSMVPIGLLLIVFSGARSDMAASFIIPLHQKLGSNSPPTQTPQRRRLALFPREDSRFLLAADRSPRLDARASSSRPNTARHVFVGIHTLYTLPQPEHYPLPRSGTMRLPPRTCIKARIDRHHPPRSNEDRG